MLLQQLPRLVRLLALAGNNYSGARVHGGAPQGDEPTVVRVRNMQEAFRAA